MKRFTISVSTLFGILGFFALVRFGGESLGLWDGETAREVGVVGLTALFSLHWVLSVNSERELEEALHFQEAELQRLTEQVAAAERLQLPDGPRSYMPNPRADFAFALSSAEFWILMHYLDIHAHPGESGQLTDEGVFPYPEAEEEAYLDRKGQQLATFELIRQIKRQGEERLDQQNVLFRLTLQFTETNLSILLQLLERYANETLPQSVGPAEVPQGVQSACSSLLEQIREELVSNYSLGGAWSSLLKP